MSEKINILYIAGQGRSGSTLIGNILGELNGNCTVGEPWYVWNKKNNFANSDRCSCGSLLNNCSHWQKILTVGFNKSNFNNINSPKGVEFSTGIFPLLSSLFNHSFYSNEYIEFLETFYQAIKETNKAKFIIDESKIFGHYLALKQIPKIELYIIHLVRDPRAVVHSWQRKKARANDDKEFLPRWGLYKATRTWIIQNLLLSFEFMNNKQRYLFLRYEDFAKSPQYEIEKVMKWANFHKPSPFLTSNKVRVQKKHHLIGSNPIGSAHGEINIQLDNAWESEMSIWKKLLITSLVWPFLLLYRYPLFK